MNLTCGLPIIRALSRLYNPVRNAIRLADWRGLNLIHMKFRVCRLESSFASRSSKPKLTIRDCRRPSISFSRFIGA